MTERQGIEIDYCPQCRGVWLDRGELDKIIEKSAREVATNNPNVPVASPTQHTVQPQAPFYQPRHGHEDKHRYDSQGYSRKKSVWQELFD
jgi:Zn-finger nucleic acid-binding protein